VTKKDKDKDKDEKKVKYNGPGGCANALPGLFLLLPFAVVRSLMMMATKQLKCAWCGKPVSALKHTLTKVKTGGKPRCSTCAAKAALGNLGSPKY
jgi:DNA-directed RNA polymerase subunit RPC12/RpoP